MLLNQRATPPFRNNVPERARYREAKKHCQASGIEPLASRGGQLRRIHWSHRGPGGGTTGTATWRSWCSISVLIVGGIMPFERAVLLLRFARIVCCWSPSGGAWCWGVSVARMHSDREQPSPSVSRWSGCRWGWSHCRRRRAVANATIPRMRIPRSHAPFGRVRHEPNRVTDGAEFRSARRAIRRWKRIRAKNAQRWHGPVLDQSHATVTLGPIGELSEAGRAASRSWAAPSEQISNARRGPSSAPI